MLESTFVYVFLIFFSIGCGCYQQPEETTDQKTYEVAKTPEQTVDAAQESKIRFDKTDEIMPFEQKEYILDTLASKQKYRITVESDEPVDFAVVLTSSPKKPLSEKKQAKSIKVDVDIPAKEEFSIQIIGGAKKAKYTLKVKSTQGG